MMMMLLLFVVCTDMNIHVLVCMRDDSQKMYQNSVLDIAKMQEKE